MKNQASPDIYSKTPPSRKVLRGNYDDILGESAKHLEVLKSVDLFAKSSSTVLITGETGTGKELVAKALHTQCPRAKYPIVTVNCAGLVESLLENELFGHERGAFTGADWQHIGLFETASRGTLFLDEIGELPMSLQPKLLRALQDGTIRRIGGTEQIPVDVHVVAATNRDLAESAKAGRFREDLYQRLKPLHIHLPALRERQEDIHVLATHFLAEEAKHYNQETKILNPEVLSLFHTYAWPGNIRELKGVIESAVLLAEQNTVILPAHLPEELRTSQAPPVSLPDAAVPSSTSATAPGGATLPFPLGTTLKEIERSAILETLVRENGNKSKAADVLGITRATLRTKFSSSNA